MDGHRRYQWNSGRPAAYVAEFIGTFVLVFSITLVVSLFVNPQGTGSDWVVVGLVHVLVLFLIVLTIGSISGAHVNPAVTLSLLALRKIRPNDARRLHPAAARRSRRRRADDEVPPDRRPRRPAERRRGGAQLQPDRQRRSPGVVAEGLGTFLLVWAVIGGGGEPARQPRDWAPLVIGDDAGLRGDDHRPADRRRAQPGALVRPRAGGRRVERLLGLHHRPDRRRRCWRRSATGTCSSSSGPGWTRSPGRAQGPAPDVDPPTVGGQDTLGAYSRAGRDDRTGPLDIVRTVRRVTFSRNYTLSLSRTCRCYCKYCAFATHQPHLHEPDEVERRLDDAARRGVQGAARADRRDAGGRTRRWRERLRELRARGLHLLRGLGLRAGARAGHAAALEPRRARAATTSSGCAR